MKFDLVRPCKSCPFRMDRDGFLRGDRADEIASCLLDEDRTFACHQTLGHEEDPETGYVETCQTPESQHCAGALIFCEANEQPNQMMRIAERLGLYDRRKLDMGAPVFTDREEFVNHHEFNGKALGKRRPLVMPNPDPK
jgi:hypothetical protein